MFVVAVALFFILFFFGGGGFSGLLGFVIFHLIIFGKFSAIIS